MRKYFTEWNHFKGSLETNISFYNLDNNITIEVNLYRTSNSLEIDYKVIESNRNNGIYNINTLEKGFKQINITYNQFQKPTKKVYLAKIEKALNDILTKYFTIGEVEQAENDPQNEKLEVVADIENDKADSIVNTEEKITIQLSPIQKIRNDIFNREHKEAINYFLLKYGNLQIGDTIHIKTQKELDHLEFIDYDEVIRIYEDKQDNSKIKATVMRDIKEYYKKNPLGYIS
jgi:hypothetical protein